MNMVYIAVTCVVILVLVALAAFALRLRPQGESASLPYAKRRYLLSKAEKAFYSVLRQAVPQDYIVFVKVRLADVLEVTRGTQQSQAHRNRIDRKHLDFLLCDQQWLEPRMAIELDDASHQRPQRRERDAFLEDACAAAGLPLLRIPAQKSYHTRDLQSAIQSHVAEQLPTNGARTSPPS